MTITVHSAHTSKPQVETSERGLRYCCELVLLTNIGPLTEGAYTGFTAKEAAEKAAKRARKLNPPNLDIWEERQ